MSAPGPGAIVGPWVIDQVLSFVEPVRALAHRADRPTDRALLEIATRKGLAETRQRRAILALRSFAHDAIPRVVDAGATDDHLWTASEPFDGETLADRIAGGPLDGALACAWLDRIARALDHVHGRGWVHRGLCPEQILVGRTGGDLVLLGFESALEHEERTELARLPRHALSYVAPEVLADPSFHAPRADVYAFGLIAHEMLTGRPAFPAAVWGEAADRDRGLLEWKTRSAPLDPGPGHPDWLRRLVRKCTEPDPSQRLPDIEAAVACLEAARPSWDRPSSPAPTPMFVAREELPPIAVRPSLDPELIAEVIAQTRQPSLDRTLLVLVAGGMGCAAGLAASALVVMFVELSRLG